MPPSSCLLLYDHLSQHGPKGLRDIAASLYGGDVIEARQALSYLEGQDLIEQVPPVHGFDRMSSSPRQWTVMDPR